MKKKGEVFIVEDDPGLREALAGMLEEEGFSFQSARDGLEAIEMLRRGFRPCVILLDLTMPIVSGWEFRLFQQREPALVSIPVVVITAGAYNPDDLAWLQPTEVLHKPIDPERLIAVIRKHGSPAKKSSRREKQS